LKDIENFRAIIGLYNSMRTQDSAAKTINERQIDGMLAMSVVPENRLYRGMNMQGQHVTLSCQQDNWGSLGSLHLWGCVLERFLASYAAINTYTRFEIEDKSKGISLKWPLRQGLKPRL
jgi:type VI secretion system protein ImpG